MSHAWFKGDCRGKFWVEDEVLDQNHLDRSKRQDARAALELKYVKLE